MSAMQGDDAIVIEPERPANATVIWLHGLGADAGDFVPVADQISFPSGLSVRFILPNAPVRPITINGGARMRGWYDLQGIGPQYPEDEQGIRQSQKTIEYLIEKERNHGITPDHIVLAGFSQGGAVILQTGLRFAQPLAGILALSTYLPLRESLAQEFKVQQQDTPILFMHGSHDPVVPYDFAEMCVSSLKQSRLNVELKQYPMDHTVCLQQIEDINQFLIEVLSNPREV